MAPYSAMGPGSAEPCKQAAPRPGRQRPYARVPVNGKLRIGRMPISLAMPSSRANSAVDIREAHPDLCFIGQTGEALPMQIWF